MKMDKIFTFLCAHVVTGSDILVDSNFLPVSYLANIGIHIWPTLAFHVHR